MNKINEPKLSGVYANMKVIYKAMGLSEKEAYKKVLKKCNEVIKKGVKI